MKNFFRVMLIVAALAGAVLAVSCGRHGNPGSVNSEFATFIKSYTGGIISGKSTVKVQLSSPVPGAVPGEEVKDGIISFSPSVKGSARWLAADMVEFIPESGALKPGQTYICRFRLDKVMKVRRRFSRFTFRFLVAQKVAEIIPGDMTITSSSPAEASAEGIVRFSEEVSAEQAKKMFSVSYPSDSVEFSLVPGDNPSEYRYEVFNLARGEKDRKLKLSLDLSGTSFKSDSSPVVVIPARGRFSVTGAVLEEGDSPCVAVSFSEALKEDSGFEGLVFLEGVSRQYLRVRDNVVRVYFEGSGDSSVKLTVDSGVRSHDGARLGETFTQVFVPGEPKPAVEIPLQGTILPDPKELILPFRAVNLKAVDIKVIKIYEDNILSFLQDNDLAGGSSIRRSGRLICKRTVRLDADPSKDLRRWQDFSVDLSGLFKEEPGAIYRVRITFNRDYSLYGSGRTAPSGGMIDLSADGLTEEETAVWDIPEPYYYDNDYDWSEYEWKDRDNPLKPTYYMVYDYPEKNLMSSGLGVIAKYSGGDVLWVSVSGIKTAGPVFNADLSVYDYQLREIGYAHTDPDGMAQVSLSGKPFVVVASKGNSKTYLKVTDGTENSLSRFDVGGKTLEKGLKAFVYGERGVWRPGDTLHLTMILDDREGRVPDTHPVVMELYAPEGQFYSKQICSSGKNGFYVFSVPTRPEDPTGSWNAWFKIGGASFHKALRIESVKPNRLKIETNLENKTIRGGSLTEVSLSSRWLTGPPASRLRADMKMNLSSAGHSFKGFEAYSFTRPMSAYQGGEHRILDVTLDASGTASEKVRMPDAGDAPGMLRADIVCSVTEPGGDISYSTVTVPFSPYESYVGVKMPEDGREGFVETDRDHPLSVAVVDSEGKRIAGRKVEYRIYKLRWSWWWESKEESLDSYVNGTGAELVSSGEVVSGQQDATIPFRVDYPDWGRYLVYVRDTGSGHVSGGVIYADWPASRGRSSKTDPTALSMLTFNTDKDTYTVGETASVFIPAAVRGEALVSIENSRGVISREWVHVKGTDVTYKLKITGEMAPDFYIHVTLLQPHDQTGNDLPVRLYGVRPVMVEDPSTKLSPVISMADAVRPGEAFTVKVREKTGKPMTYTLAVVDEGLLDLTSFKTPDPWSSIYAREALGVKTWDIYDQVIGAFKGRFSPMFSIGGDQGIIVNNRKDNRFNPVVEFLGPFTLSSGTASHSIKLPMYVGSVRVMVVAGGGGAYGNAEKTVAVKSPLMVLPSLPRTLAPGEKVNLPVNVFAMENNVSKADVEVKVSGPVKVEGPSVKTVAFSGRTDELAVFSLASTGEGTAVVTVTATGGGFKASQTVSVEVRNPDPLETIVTRAVIDGTSSRKFSLEGDLTEASLEFSSFPSVDCNSLFSWVKSYPYNCTEQISARGLVLLSIRDRLGSERAAEADKMIPEMLGVLYSRQMSGGDFSLWPGSTVSDRWVTSMAGEFMAMASAAGFPVSRTVQAGWSDFQKRAAREWKFSSEGNADLDQAYRLYTLALAGEPESGAMNRLRENGSISTAASWMLSCAYSVCGKTNVASGMISPSESYQSRSGAGRDLSYSSPVRDLSVALSALTLAGRIPEAIETAGEVARSLTSGWYVTQEAAFASVALGRLASKVSSESFDLDISQGGEAPVNVRSSSGALVRPLKAEEGVVEVKNNAKGAVYAVLSTTGKPSSEGVRAKSEGVSLKVSWLDASGRAVDPSDLLQGTEFTANITVLNTGAAVDRSSLALTLAVPSGWEIFSERLLYGGLQEGAGYTDVRDDKVIWYFDLPAGASRTFKTTLRAAYAGEFVLPSVKCEAMYDAHVNACTASSKAVVRMAR